MDHVKDSSLRGSGGRGRAWTRLLTVVCFFSSISLLSLLKDNQINASLCSVWSIEHTHRQLIAFFEPLLKWVHSINTSNSEQLCNHVARDTMSLRKSLSIIGQRMLCTIWGKSSFLSSSFRFASPPQVNSVKHNKGRREIEVTHSIHMRRM